MYTCDWMDIYCIYNFVDTVDIIDMIMRTCLKTFQLLRPLCHTWHVSMFLTGACSGFKPVNENEREIVWSPTIYSSKICLLFRSSQIPHFFVSRSEDFRWGKGGSTIAEIRTSASSQYSAAVKSRLLVKPRFYTLTRFVQKQLGVNSKNSIPYTHNYTYAYTF